MTMYWCVQDIFNNAEYNTKTTFFDGCQKPMIIWYRMNATLQDDKCLVYYLFLPVDCYKCFYEWIKWITIVRVVNVHLVFNGFKVCWFCSICYINLYFLWKWKLYSTPQHGVCNVRWLYVLTFYCCKGYTDPRMRKYTF